MSDPLVYLSTKYSVNLHARRMPIEIPGTDRVSLARLFHLLGYVSGVEVGVERAAYTEVLARENPGVRLVGVDPWKAHRGYRDHVRQDKLDRFYAEAQERLRPYHRTTLRRAFSVDAAREFADGSFDFVYLDGNHNLQNVIADLAAWTPKVRDGGIVSGHDYVRHRWPNQVHVVQAIHAWTDAYEIRPWFVFGAEAKDGRRRDDARSWAYVKAARPVVPKGEKPVRQ